MTSHVESTYAKIAQAYSDEFFADTSDIPIINELTKRLPKGARVLDLGCGPGQFTKYLVDQGLVAEGVDISDEMLAIARARVPKVTFRKMDMRKLEYPDHTFDGILAAYSIIHIPAAELPGVFAGIRRVIRPNGYVLFIAQQGEPDQIRDEPLAKGEKIFVNFFSKERLNSALIQAGFKVVDQGSAEQASAEVMSSAVLWAVAT